MTTLSNSTLLFSLAIALLPIQSQALDVTIRHYAEPPNPNTSFLLGYRQLAPEEGNYVYITDESDPQDGKPGETVATMPAGSTWVVWDGTSGSQNYAVFDVSDTGIGKIRPLSEEHRIGKWQIADAGTISATGEGPSYSPPPPAQTKPTSLNFFRSSVSRHAGVVIRAS